MACISLAPIRLGTFTFPLAISKITLLPAGTVVPGSGEILITEPGASSESTGIVLAINIPTEFKPNNENYTFVQKDSIEFLDEWPKDKRIDVAYVDDWHSYSHVKKQLEILDQLVGPSSIILLHDLMYGNTDPFYHSDLTLKEGQWADGGPYRAVAELNPQFWEWATLPWNNGLTILRKKYSNKYHRR